MNRLRTAALAAMLAAGGAAAGPTQPIVLQGLDCRGDDAAWRLDATRTTALFTATVPRKREVVFRGSLQSLAAPGSLVWRGDSTHLPRETLVLTAREEACKTAGADLPYRAVLSIRPGEAASGCCLARAGYDPRVAPLANPAAKAADDWSRAVIELLPAINACIARDGARAKAVAAASASGGTVRVRLIENTGTTVDCIAEASGRGTPTLTAVNAGDTVPA